ncbi:hypothetical protein C8Q80DRAFT_1247411 [Daedaleopsis nitida]|nr:hypothetical protein C8Q80DRAFT_1247411 [Daedaleopsis nitida]
MSSESLRELDAHGILEAQTTSAQTPNQDISIEETLSWLDSLPWPELQNQSNTNISSPRLSCLEPPPANQAAGSCSLPPTTAVTAPLDTLSVASCYASSLSPSEDSRRISKKLKIALDPSQPLTKAGAPRARVFVACHECRARKARCDGAKPVCFNCKRHDPDMESCNYDPTPKRRGQDKMMGSRSRTQASSGRRSRRTHPCSKLGTLNRDEAIPTSRIRIRNARPPLLNFEELLREFDPADFDPAAVPSYQLPWAPELVSDADEHEEVELNAGQMLAEPSIQFAKDTWWDALLMLYVTHDMGGDIADVTLTADLRITTTQRVFSDLYTTLRASIQYASFLYLPRLFEKLLNPSSRNTVQPSLLLSMLAVGAFAQSYERKGRDSAKGRKRALQLAEHAHSALQASLLSNWVDVGLVQAAWYITYLESQGHPEHSGERCRSALLLMDSLIRLLDLTSLDADQPESRYAIFDTQHLESASHASPNVTFTGAAHDTPSFGIGGTTEDHYAGIAPSSCDCDQHTVAQQWPAISEIAPLWAVTTMWPVELSEWEVLKEEHRRVVWSSVMLSAGHSMLTVAICQRDPSDMFIKDYRNLSLLFPGEVIRHAGSVSVGKNSVWSLSLRATILWHTSVRLHSIPFSTPVERAQFASNLWLEADAIEAALKWHTCRIEDVTYHQARDYLFMTRMFISDEFNQSYAYHASSRSGGMWESYREKAEMWLQTQTWVCNRLYEALKNPEDESRQRPLFIFWLMAHISRALALFKGDPTLLVALDAAKSFSAPLELLMWFWPSQSTREQWEPLRYQLVHACLKGGVAPPDATLPV